MSGRRRSRRRSRRRRAGGPTASTLRALTKRGKRVVLLGEAPQPRTALASALRHAGYAPHDVFAAHDVPSLLDGLARPACELALVDADCLSGSLDALQAIARDARRRVPLVVTGANWETLENVPALGGDLFLPAEAETGSACATLADARALRAMFALDRGGHTVERAPAGLVLVVEDLEAIRSLMSAVLGLDRYEVEQAPDGIEGLQAIEHGAGRFDLLWCNYLMPKLDGLGMLRRAAAARRALVPCVLDSGALDGRAAWRAGAWAWLQRPWELEHVRDLVRRALDLRRARLLARGVSRRCP